MFNGFEEPTGRCIGAISPVAAGTIVCQRIPLEAWDKGGIDEYGDLRLVDGLTSCRLGQTQLSGLAVGESRNVGIDQCVGVRTQGWFVEVLQVPSA
jgi:hypothetical protein